MKGVFLACSLTQPIGSNKNPHLNLTGNAVINLFIDHLNTYLKNLDILADGIAFFKIFAYKFELLESLEAFSSSLDLITEFFLLHEPSLILSLSVEIIKILQKSVKTCIDNDNQKLGDLTCCLMTKFISYYKTDASGSVVTPLHAEVGKLIYYFNFTESRVENEFFDKKDLSDIFSRPFVEAKYYQNPDKLITRKRSNFTEENWNSFFYFTGCVFLQKSDFKSASFYFEQCILSFQDNFKNVKGVSILISF